MSHSISLNARHAATACQTHDLETRLAKIADGGPAAITDRLGELDHEWSAGRVSKAVLAVTILAGTVLALAVNPWWVILPVAAGLFLLQYLFAHTSWMVKVFQEGGFRTKACIEHEKFALRTLRGDFRHLPTLHDIEEKDDISRLEGEGGIVVEQDAHKIDSLTAAKEVVQATTPH